ncbi:MAG: cytochrome c biogenesis protein CcsA [Deltaproteobacteria bacterium]|nr:cytochrome c biogenesis protein CcsA [Deltaproteobacteria bacterium]
MRGSRTAICALLAAPALAFCQWLIWVYAPVERGMGLVQKIFYLHLPLAWWALASFFVVFAASIAYLRSRRPWWDHLARAGAELGLVLAVLALVSGSVWARRSWGVWWTWDPRLTTTLVMCFVYAGCLALRGLELPRQRKSTVCAVVGIVAFLDVPLVFVSARLWRSIHPAVFASEGGGLEPEMRLTVLACVAAFGLLWLALIALRSRQLDAAERIEHLLLSRREPDAYHRLQTNRAFPEGDEL